MVDLTTHSISEGNRLFRGTDYERNWVIYHDVLSTWWSKEAQEYMASRGFAKRQIRGLGHTNTDNRYHDKLPGDSPEYMPLDSNLFSDLECCVRWNVAGTRFLPRDHPDKFSLATPHKAWSTVTRTWEHAPSSERIVEDILRVFVSIDQVVEHEGEAVDFEVLRHGRRDREHRESLARVKRRSKKISDKKKLSDIVGIHPVARRCIYDFCDLTME